MEALRVLNRGFQEFLDQGDARLKDWPMMQNPFPGVAMIAAYIYFVKVAGPQFMQHRKPYDLRSVMAAYNFILVLVNLYIFLGIGWYGYFNGYSLKCQPVDYSSNYDAVRMAEMGYLFYLTKFVEFADTIFFVLRKKDNQISALHVIHHSIVPFSLWFGVKFAPGGYNALFPFLNSLVHVIMYTYYGLAAMGDKFKKYLVWKKYMTYLQLTQFILVMIYAMSLWYNQCNVSRTFIVMNFVHAALFLGLFTNFFVQSYMRRPPPKKPAYLSGECTASQIKASDAKAKANGSHAEKLVSLMEKEEGDHLHSCADGSCCQMSCGQFRKTDGSSQETNCQKLSAVSVPEYLRNRKLFKGL